MARLLGVAGWISTLALGSSAPVPFTSSTSRPRCPASTHTASASSKSGTTVNDRAGWRVRRDEDNVLDLVGGRARHRSVAPASPLGLRRGWQAPRGPRCVRVERTFRSTIRYIRGGGRACQRSDRPISQGRGRASSSPRNPAPRRRSPGAPPRRRGSRAGPHRRRRRAWPQRRRPAPTAGALCSG